MTELDSWSKDLILAAKGADDPTDAQRARLRASLIAATAGAGIASGGVVATAAASSKTALWLKLLLSVVSVGAVTGIGYSVYSAAVGSERQGSEPQAAAPAMQAAVAPPKPEAPEPAAAAPAAQADQDEASAQPEAPAPVIAQKSAAPTRSATAAKSTAKPGLAEEVALIARARSAVQSGNTAEAQKLLAQHRKEFPRGSLGLERSGLELILACRSGGGKSQAKAFLKRFGKTPIAGSVRSACGISE